MGIASDTDFRVQQRSGVWLRISSPAWFLGIVLFGSFDVRAEASGNAMFDRLSALEETATCPFHSDAEFRVFVDEIRRIAEEIAADPDHPDVSDRIRSLFAIAEGRGMEELRPMIVAALRERPEFGVLLPALVWEARTSAYDRLRPLLAEYFFDAYEAISFPEEPDADGFCRIRRKFSRKKGRNRVIVVNLEFPDAAIRPLPAVFALVSSGDGSSNMPVFFGFHPIPFGDDAGWSVHDRWAWSPAEAAWIFDGGGGGYWRGDSSGNFVRLTPGTGKVEYRFLAFPDGRIDFEAVCRPLTAKVRSKR